VERAGVPALPPVREHRPLQDTRTYTMWRSWWVVHPAPAAVLASKLGRHYREMVVRQLAARPVTHAIAQGLDRPHVIP